MDGTTKIDDGSPVKLDPVWQAEISGDYNGNGKSDMLFRHKGTGAVKIFLLDGFTAIVEGSPGTVPSGTWQIK